MKSFQFLLIALVAAMLLFGCCGSLPQNAGPQKPGAQAGGNNTQQPTGGNDVPPVPPKQNEPAATPMDAFLSALKLSNSGWSVAYSVSVGGQTPYTMKEYAKGLDRFRVDTIMQGTESRVYKVGSDMYTCTNTGTWVCYRYSGVAAGEDMGALQSGLENEPETYTVTLNGTMNIAGVTATCYKVVKDGTTTRYCISAEGVPLYISMSGGSASATVMSATSYSTSVSNSDFTPPAVAQDIPKIPEGGDACSYCEYFTGDDKASCLATCATAG